MHFWRVAYCDRQNFTVILTCKMIMANRKNNIPERLKTENNKIYLLVGTLGAYILFIAYINPNSFLINNYNTDTSWWEVPGLLAIIVIFLYSHIRARGELLCPKCNGNIGYLIISSRCKALKNMKYCPFCSCDLLE